MPSIREWYKNKLQKPNYTIFVPDPVRAEVEAASGGKNTVLYDDLEQPSIMVVFEKSDVSALHETAYGSGLYPAFVRADGTERSQIFIGKYLASIANGRAVSLPGRDPANTVNWDTARGFCAAKGVGWDLTPNDFWAVAALQSHANNTMPTGNNNLGRDHGNYDQQGLRQDWLAPGTAGTARTLTGSGPNAWNHDGTPYGISDMNGNVFEWQGGFRLMDGEIQIIPDCIGRDHGVSSAAWRAILVDGTLVDPWTAGTLKFDAPTAPSDDGTVQGLGTPVLRDALINAPDPAWEWGNALNDYTAGAFENVASDVVAPNILKTLAIFPALSGYASDFLYVRHYGERLPVRGGSWIIANAAGAFYLHLGYHRSIANTGIGFRPAFGL